MAGTNIHSQITDSAEIHVPKGFTEASNNTVPMKNSVGLLEWRAAANVSNKNTFDATVDPTVSDDSNDGYSVGSRWINVTNDKAFELVDASVGAAIWREVTNTLAEIHVPRTDNPHEVTKAQVGLSDVPNLKMNLNAVADPTINDDSGDGYSVGSRWLRPDTAEEWVLMDATAGAALWAPTTENSPIVGIDHSTLSNLTSDDHLQYLNRDGSRPMTGALDMDDNAINNASEVNGIKIPCHNVVRVTKNPGSGEFASVKDAVDSITGNTALNPFIVYVGVGVFVEPQIVMKPFVFIIGTDDSSSIIQASSSSMPLIVGCHSSEIKNIQLAGPTDANVPLVYHTGVAMDFNAFSVIECAFQSASLVYHIENNNSFPTLFRTEACRIVSSASVEAIMLVEGSNAFPLFCFLNSFIYRRMTAPYPDHLFDFSGSNARVILDGILVETNSTTSHGFHVQDGVNLGILNSVLSGLDIGLHVHNIGAAPTINSSNFAIRNCNQDILIEHPGTAGSLNGAADITKTTVDDGATITLSMIDPENGGSFDTGPLSLGKKVSDLTNVSDLLEGEPGMGIISGGFLSDGGGFDVDVSAGFGYAQVNPFPNHRIKRLEWPGSTITLLANQDMYIYINSSGVLTAAAGIGNTTDIILIGRVVTNGTGIELIDQSPMLVRHAINYVNRIFREGFGAIYDTGSIVTENVTPFRLDVTAGVYFFSLNRYTPVGGTLINFTQYYRDGIGGYNRATTNAVNNTQYDNGTGTLASLTAGYYVKHTLYVNCDDSDEKYFLVLGQAEYSALAAVESAPLPIPPSWIKDAVTPIASVVIQQGDTNIVEFLDIRPVIGFKSSGVSASADHGNLLGLADDDHQQYLLVSGARAMLSHLNMGTNNITNAGTYNGVTVEAHAARHLPNGADPITTAAPTTAVGGNTSNAVGTANTLARSDHQHATATGAASTQTPDQANAAGASNNLARADHTHNIPTAAAVGLNADSANAQGSGAAFARNDHTHAVATGAPSTQTPDQANAAGASPNLARADHIHTIPTAAAALVSTSTANGQGAAATFARSDHSHKVDITNNQVTATASTTTTSATDVLIAGMTLTPASGTYLVMFSTTLESNSNDADIFVSIWSAAAQVAHSQRQNRPQSTNNFGSVTSMPIPIATQAIVTVNGSQAIEARWRRTAGTATSLARTMSIIKLQ